MNNCICFPYHSNNSIIVDSIKYHLSKDISIFISDNNVPMGYDKYFMLNYGYCLTDVFDLEDHRFDKICTNKYSTALWSFPNSLFTLIKQSNFNIKIIDNKYKHFVKNLGVVQL